MTNTLDNIILDHLYDNTVEGQSIELTPIEAEHGPLAVGNIAGQLHAAGLIFGRQEGSRWRLAVVAQRPPDR
jgi:hypothetical protein